MDGSLDLQVKALLNKRRGDWLTVAERAGVSYSWLSKFANGHIDNPGYATLKRLFEYLSGVGVKGTPAVPASATEAEG